MSKLKKYEEFVNEDYKEALNEGKYDKDLAAFNALKNKAKSTFYTERPDTEEKDLFSGFGSRGKKSTGTYRVSELDERGYPLGTIGLYKADSENHACLRAALDKKNLEIYVTGYYGATIEETSKLQNEISDLEAQIAELKRLQKVK